MALGTGAKIVLGLSLAGAVTYLVLSDSGEGVLEYVFVDQVVDQPERYEGRTIKIHGVVVPGSVERRVGASADYQFVIEHEGRRLAVHHTDIVPDTFRESGDVILTGRLNQTGDLFESNEMSAKCPSKYQEQAKAAKGRPVR
jgi:cytochrome c-type biogenesis protein CcmE